METKPTLAQQSFRALQWNYLGAFSRVFFQFFIGILLARLLGPEAFGLVAIASLVLGLGALFADFGLASVLIQRQEISNADIRYVFTFQSLIGIALTGFLEVVSPYIATFFGKPEVLSVFHALFLTFAIQGIGQTSAALLKRSLDFRRLQLAQIASYLMGYAGLGLPMAYFGWGVWSLVAAQLSQVAICTAITYAMTRHPILPKFSVAHTGFMRFGLQVTLTNLCNWGLACLDSVVIGRAFGAVQLGLYNRAFSLVSMPTYNLVSTLQGVLFSATSRMQDNMAHIRQTYLSSLAAVGFICLPVFLVVAALPETVILGVYGKQWQAAVPLLTPLALAMPLSALMGLGGPIMTGMGKAGFELRTQFLGLLVFVPLLWAASHYSALEVAWIVLVGYTLRFLAMTHVVLGLIGLQWSAVLSALAGPLALGLICAALTFWVDTQLHQWGVSESSALVAVIGTAGLTLVLSFVVGKKWLVPVDLAHQMRKFGDKVPSQLQWVFAV